MIVKDVVDRIIHACRVPEIPNTCDQLIVGDWSSQVTGIVTTFMATPDVIRASAVLGANLIITHEPTFFSHTDERAWLAEDEVYLRKQQLIDQSQVNIWRFHDHMHSNQPDSIYAGLDQALGWGAYSEPDEKHCYTIPVTTVAGLADFLKEKLRVQIAQIVGDPGASVERVGVLVGGGSLGLGSEIMPMQLMRERNLDVIVCGEILEWTLCAYVRDAAQLGLNRALIILGHDRTEEVGMQRLPAWLRPLLPADIPVYFVESGDPFSYR